MSSGKPELPPRGSLVRAKLTPIECDSEWFTAVLRDINSATPLEGVAYCHRSDIPPNERSSAHLPDDRVYCVKSYKFDFILQRDAVLISRCTSQLPSSLIHMYTGIKTLTQKRIVGCRSYILTDLYIPRACIRQVVGDLCGERLIVVYKEKLYGSKMGEL